MRWIPKRLLIVSVLVGLAVFGGVQAHSWWQHHSVPKYVTATVSRGRVEMVVNSSGTIKPVLSVSVGAFTSGPIARVFVDFNSPVKKDQVLATIDPKLFEAAIDRDHAALESQIADLSRVEALLQQAKNNEQRARQLQAINKDYLSDTDMDQFHFTRLTYEAQIRLAKASIRQAEANLKNSEANLGYTKILAPVDGIVIERKVDPGQTVAASFQTPELFTIAPEMEKHMYVFASVDEADIGLIRTAQERGRTVRFTVDAYPGDLFEGKIAQIRKNSTTTQNVVTYPVVIEAPNPNLKLLPGMTANLTFPIEAKENVLRVPTTALRFVPQPAQVRPEDRHYVEAMPISMADNNTKRSADDKADLARKRRHRVVWIQDQELLRAVPVTLGLMENHYAELVTGDLQEDQAVVLGTENMFGPR
ncbi:MAG TPA: efflux RND transporter periplasmic adaptor subunit [Gemmataceae bacterium]|nr:efflux RND transporter periplasmic adaptor subunit [Gemmataceae bacterium]